MRSGIDPQLPHRQLGRRPYPRIWREMRAFTKTRGHSEDDQLWFVEHDPVFTQGLSGKAERLPRTGGIAVFHSDRGGQATYHGPGQAVVYLLIDIQTARVGIRALVRLIENSVIATLAEHGIVSHARADAPGVYVEDGRKIASLGLKVSRGCTYHGVAINVDMDLEPFQRIEPCGLTGIEMTQVSETSATASVGAIQRQFARCFSACWYALRAMTEGRD